MSSLNVEIRPVEGMPSVRPRNGTTDLLRGLGPDSALYFSEEGVSPTRIAARVQSCANQAGIRISVRTDGDGLWVRVVSLTRG